MLRTTATVHPIDFGQLSGHEFERLVFAFLCRRWRWIQLDWHGQLGDDGGRDIWGLRENDWGREELVVVACANWRRLTVAKATDDIDKVIGEGKGVPDHVIVMAGGKVSADVKTKVRKHAEKQQIRRSEVWSGPEFEEQLRYHAESVLRRFFEGEALPDEPDALRVFVADTQASEDEALRALGPLFDRPAFYTPFYSESSLPAFRRAISDTIEAINTGIYRNREGVVVRRIPAKNDFTSNQVRGSLDSVVRDLNRLRVLFDDGIRKGRIEQCGCGEPDCPTFLVHPEAAQDLDEVRGRILRTAQELIPGLKIRPEF